MGILTEEELKEMEFINNDQSQKITLNRKSVRELINSHRNLLSANAELSFKNMNLEKERDKFKGIAKLFIDGDQIELLHQLLETGQMKGAAHE